MVVGLLPHPRGFNALIKWAAFIAALLVFPSVARANAELGIGVVKVEFDDKTVIHFYESPKSNSPTRTIRFFNDTSINSWNIVNLDGVQEWFRPESLWLDYHSFVMRVRSKRPGWIQVIVDNTTGKSFWVKSGRIMKFVTWDGFLKNMFSIERAKKFPQAIRAQPQVSSPAVKFRGKDCFNIITMRGDWIHVRQANHCERSQRDKNFRSGWIRWRWDNKLRIDYFITS
nr:hypothetical protein [uncultured bacterium]